MNEFFNIIKATVIDIEHHLFFSLGFRELDCYTNSLLEIVKGCFDMRNMTREYYKIMKPPMPFELFYRPAEQLLTVNYA